MSATAEQVTDPAAIEHGLGVFSRESVRQDGEGFEVGQVTGDARLRLYRARVDEHSILDPDVPIDQRIVVQP
jgi:hypothetical protein